MKKLIKHIVACESETGLIGVDDGLPWSCPADVNFFRNATLGNVVIMGRRTFEAIGAVFYGRTVIVPSSKYTDIGVDNIDNITTVVTVPSLDVALEEAQKDEYYYDSTRLTTDKTIWIAGGKNIYEQTSDIIDSVVLSKILYNTDDVFSKDLYWYSLPKQFNGPSSAVNSTNEHRVGYRGRLNYKFAQIMTQPYIYKGDALLLQINEYFKNYEDSQTIDLRFNGHMGTVIDWLRYHGYLDFIDDIHAIDKDDLIGMVERGYKGIERTGYMTKDVKNDRDGKLSEINWLYGDITV